MQPITPRQRVLIAARAILDTKTVTTMFAAVLAELNSIADKIERLEWLGLNDEERSAFKARLLSTLATAADEQDARSLLAMSDTPERQVLALVPRAASFVSLILKLVRLGG